MFPLKIRIPTIPITPALAVLAGLLTVCLPASAQLNGITITVSDTAPLYSETVTLNTKPTPPSAVFPAGSTVNYYEDSAPIPPTAPTPGSNGILLNYRQGPINTNKQSAQWPTVFMGGQHTVYAVVSASDGTVLFTSAPVSLNVTSALNVPATGSVYLGMAPIGFQGNPPYQPPPTPTLSNIEASLGHPLGIATSYYAYSTKNPDNGNSWHKLADEYSKGTFTPDVDLGYAISHNIIPMISWGCDADPADLNGAPNGTDADIAAAFQAESQPGATLTPSQTNEMNVIRTTADALKQIPGPVLLRWTWEFNGFWANHAACAGASYSNGGWTDQSENNFIEAWRAIWGAFQQEGATNVVFVWNPQHYMENAGAQQTADPHPFYPGDTFVDWIGVDSYQQLASPVNQTSDDFAADISPWYTDFAVHNKPMLIGETGTKNDPNGESSPYYELQQPYIVTVENAFRSGQYPLLAAYCWFDVDGYELDANGGLSEMVNMAQSTSSPEFYHNSINASAPFQTSPTPNGGSYVMNLNLTNTGLLPLTSVKVDSITNVIPIAGTAPTAPSPGSFPNLSAGQTTTGTVSFSNWTSATTCVEMTVNYTATKSDDTGGTPATYTGHNIIYVSPENALCH